VGTSRKGAIRIGKAAFDGISRWESSELGDKTVLDALEEAAGANSSATEALQAATAEAAGRGTEGAYTPGRPEGACRLA
jgi:hypothetical protein